MKDGHAYNYIDGICVLAALITSTVLFLKGHVLCSDPGKNKLYHLVRPVGVTQRRCHLKGLCHQANRQRMKFVQSTVYDTFLLRSLYFLQGKSS